MNIDGSNLKQLTDNSGFKITDRSDYSICPAWSPDHRIIFSSGDNNADLYIINSNGAHPERLTETGSQDETLPKWSPDGQHVVFQVQTANPEKAAIYIMDADGGNLEQIVSSSLTGFSPSWSLDGKKIAFHSYRDDDRGEIYVMDLATKETTRLTNNSDGDYYPVWLPRLQGIEVTEDSVVVTELDTSSPFSAQEITQRARKAVVRIETDYGTGSGFMIDENGLILTNNHLILDSEAITVILDDGREYPATLRGRDMHADLALIEIKVSGMPFLELADLGSVELGQQVFVLGYPLKAESVSVTSGLVSSLPFDAGRNIQWIQTDSAINPGNSGGPMLNDKGQVIGVVSTKLVGVAVEGVGYAISTNTVNMYLPRLK